MDLTLIVPAAIFTLLALVVAASLLIGYSSPRDRIAKSGSGPGLDQSEPEQNGISGSSNDHRDVGKSVLSEGKHHHPHPEEPAAPVDHSTSTSSSARGGEIDDEAESNDTSSLKYVPGKARSHHLEMMMSKEEREEEQRVQREQLAAIFQLLQENQETFGAVTEGDMEEQLRLYSI